MRTLMAALALAATLVSLGGCSSRHGATSPDAGGNGSAGATAGDGSDAVAGNGSATAGSSPDASGGGDATGGLGVAGTSGAGSNGSDGGRDTAVDAVTAGRLVPWQLEADGTSPLVMGIYDQQENVHCRFLRDEAGQLRCLPAALATITETKSFSDAACTKRIYLAATGVVATWVDRPTALPLPRVACAPYRYVVGTLKALPAPAPHFGGTPCAAIQPAPAPPFGQAEMTVVDVQTPDRWETGTEIDGPLIGQRMRVKIAEGSDGARFVDDLVEEHWSKPCHLVANGADVFCQAPAVASVTGDEGTQCAGKPVWRAHACDDPAFLLSAISSPTPGFALGPLWTGPVSKGGMGCRPIPASSTIDGADIFFETGAPLTDAIMDPQAWQPTGTGRLRLRGLVDDAGDVLTLPTSLLWSELDSAVIQGAHARYFDAVANTTCNPIRTPEGQLRCVPPSVVLAQSTFGFADDKCTAPAFICPGFAAACPGVVAMQADLEANGEVRAKSLTATRALATVYLSSTGTCMPNTVTGFGTFALGADLPWTPFPTLTERNVRAPDGP